MNRIKLLIKLQIECRLNLINREEISVRPQTYYQLFGICYVRLS